jgi:hypothetical protein
MRNTLLSLVTAFALAAPALPAAAAPASDLGTPATCARKHGKKKQRRAKKKQAPAASKPSIQL